MSEGGVTLFHHISILGAGTWGTPTAEIELFEFIRGEIIYREIGNESLIFAGKEFKTNDT